MKKVAVCILTIVVFMPACSVGKQSAVEGKLVDWNNKPVVGVKITVAQVQPIKGYEQFETITNADGSFRIRGLFPSSQYILKPWSDKWICKTEVKINSAPQGETEVLSRPMIIERVYANSNPELIADIATGAIAQTDVEGILIDWNNNPVHGIEVCAEEKHPIQEPTVVCSTTDEKGFFRLSGLLANINYIVYPRSEKWTCDTQIDINAPEIHGEAAVLPNPMRISQAFSEKSGSLVTDLAIGATRFTVSEDGVIIDSQTRLEWIIGPDRDTNYAEAEQWVANCSVDGGNWRMPTKQELLTLYQKGVGDRNMGFEFRTTGWWVWAEPRDSSSAWRVNFDDGQERLTGRRGSNGLRAFGVRSRE